MYKSTLSHISAHQPSGVPRPDAAMMDAQSINPRIKYSIPTRILALVILIDDIFAMINIKKAIFAAVASSSIKNSSTKINIEIMIESAFLALFFADAPIGASEIVMKDAFDCSLMT